jgi:hypothetical protein
MADQVGGSLAAGVSGNREAGLDSKLDSCCSKKGPVAGSCDVASEVFDFTEGAEFLF